MVVTRKPSLPVPGSVSRTPSSTSSPKAKGKGHKDAASPLSQNTAQQDETNGEAKASPASSNDPITSSGAKPKADRERKQGSWLFWLLLILGSAYTYSTCSKDYTLENPLCNSLSSYRTHILEPSYRAIVNHPSVAPLILRFEPMVDHTWVAYHHTVERTAPYVNYMKQRAAYAATPVWTNTVEPRIQLVRLKLLPYQQTVVEKYNTLVHQYVIRAQDQVTFLLLSVDPLYQRVAQISQKGFRASQPFIYSALESIQAAPGYAYRTVYLPATTARRLYLDPFLINGYQRVLILLTHCRSTYIDPHIAKLTSRIRQLGTGFTGSESSPSPTSPSTPKPSFVVEETVAFAEPEPTPFTDEPIVDHPATVTAEVSAEHHDQEPTPPIIPDAPEEIPEVTAQPAKENVLEPEEGETPEESLAVVNPDLPVTRAPEVTVPSPTQEAATVAPPPIREVPAAEGLSESADGGIPVTASGITEDRFNDEDKEFQELLREIERESELELEPEPEPEPEPVVEAPEPNTTTRQLTPEEKEAETAQKRAEIVDRHAVWERKLADLVTEVNTSFFKTLNKQRSSSVTFLKSAGGDPFKFASLEGEADKAIRNTENYLKSLHADQKRDTADKERLWEKVIGRVDEKFYDRLRQIEEEVNSWIKNTTALEVQLLQNSYAKIKELGASAQADLGMDYAWLDDVTYHDWQRYHALLDVAEENGKFWQSIQDGSHPNAPTNKPAGLLMELQNELQDIAEGFDNRLTQVTRQGYRTFGGGSETQPEPEPEEVSVLPIPPPELTVDGGGDIDDALLSRAAEEIEAALERVNQKIIQEEATQSKKNSEDAVPPQLEETSMRQSTSPVDELSMEEPASSVPSTAPLQTQPIEKVEAALSREQEKIGSVSSSQSIAESALSSKASASAITESGPPVSILPTESSEADVAEAIQGILQRGKEEVEEAFERAEEGKTTGKGQEE